MKKEDWGNMQLSGAFGLLAGFINVLAFKSIGLTVTHVTGTVTKVGINIIDLEVRMVLVGTGLWVSYVLGSAIGEVLNKKVGVIAPLFMEGIIFIAIGLFMTEEVIEKYRVIADLIGCVTAGGMGMQNAITSGTSMSKTTHLTGASTELGIALAKKDKETLTHMSYIIVGFLFGAFIAFSAEHFIGIHGFVIPGMVIIIIASYNLDRGFFLRSVRKKTSQVYGIVHYDDVFKTSSKDNK